MGTKAKYLRYCTDASVGWPVLRGKCDMLVCTDAVLRLKEKAMNPRSLNPQVVWCGPVSWRHQTDARPFCGDLRGWDSQSHRIS